MLGIEEGKKYKKTNKKKKTGKSTTTGYLLPNGQAWKHACK